MIYRQIRYKHKYLYIYRHVIEQVPTYQLPSLQFVGALKFFEVRPCADWCFIEGTQNCWECHVTYCCWLWKILFYMIYYSIEWKSVCNLSRHIKILYINIYIFICNFVSIVFNICINLHDTILLYRNTIHMYIQISIYCFCDFRVIDMHQLCTKVSNFH